MSSGAALARRGWPLALADQLAINAAFAAAHALRYGLGLGPEIKAFIPYRDYAPWGVVLGVLVGLLLALEGQYGRRRRLTWFENVYSAATATLVGVALLIVVLYGVRPEAQSRLMLPYAAGLSVVAIALVRAADGAWRGRLRRRGHGVQRTLIVGAGESGRAIMRNLVAQPNLGYRVIGFLDDDGQKRAQPIGRFEPLGATGDLAAVLAREPVDLVIVTLPWTARERILAAVEACEASGVSVRIVPDLLQLSLNQVDTESLNGIPLIAVRGPAIVGWRMRAKRALDVGLAVAILVLAAPVLLIVAALIVLESPGPVLFRQERVGRFGRRFTCLKFRSMHLGADARRDDLRHRNEATGPIFKMRSDPRVTRVGRVIRRLSIDELPQLWNVVIGDMSLVGPRPPMPCEVVEYQDWHRRRLEVAPGLTGLWQVSGRSKLTFDEMVMLDLFYAENWSLGLDLRILLRTVPSVLLGTGAY